jgi:Ca2+-binding EF-hand superfamily protein
MTPRFGSLGFAEAPLPADASAKPSEPKEILFMRSIFLVLLVLPIATSLAIAAEQPASLRPVPGDAQDLVLTVDSRPYLIRLHLQINGRSFRGNWDESIAHLFRYLDADGDGVLSKKEAALAPSKAQWVQLMTGIVIEPDAAPEFAELAGSATANVNLIYFSRYYRNSGAGALQVEWGRHPPASDLLTDALFQHLDKNKDGRLSQAELTAAETVLHPLDNNGDEILEAQELSPRGAGAFSRFDFRAATEKKPVPEGFPFAVREADSPAEKPPDLELIASLQRGARTGILLLPGADNVSKQSLGTRKFLLPSNPDGAMRIALSGNQLEVVRDAGEAKLNKQLLKQFESMAGKDGMIDEKRIYQPPFTFVALLRLADRNGDNRLSRKELADYLDVQEKLLFRTTYLTVLDRGISLFEYLDADHDGRLSPREQRTAWKQLAPWDRKNNGYIERRQVPRQFQLILRYGQSRAANLEIQQAFAEMPPFRDRSRGPLWFRKMDHNRDGDVSQKEFLGTSEQFRRIDRDGDGLIDADEAEYADKELRKRR